MNVWLRRAIRVWLAFFVSAIVGALAWALASKRAFVPIDGAEDDEIALGTFFQPIEFSSTAHSFRGGTMTCGFGGGVVDLGGATLDPGGAMLHVACAFGGGQVTVPGSWPVDVEVFSVFGGVSDARGRAAPVDGGPHLTITGWTLFGGLGIVAAATASEPATT